jgi:mono/diheme cytochrome c family protein
MTSLVILLVTALGGVALGQTAPSAKNGKVVFDKWCVYCHGAAGPSGPSGESPLPGTAALSVKYKGKLPAVLEQRSDLRPEFVRAVVRGGLFGMPITRKTEISNAELEDIVAYLTAKKR